VSEHATHAPPPPENDLPLLDKHNFLFRRLHSLSGIVPVGLFVMMHLFTNFQMMVGDYQHEVEFIHSLPALLIIEWVLWLSIGFHSVLGVIYAATGRPNVKQYKYADNWRYTAQRVTGYLAVIFIFLHVATLRWRWDFFGWFTPFFVAGPDGQPLSMATTAAALQASVGVLVLYIIGVASVIYHWSNGLWTAAISWGVTVSVASQKRWGVVCALIGLSLTVFSVGGIYASMKYDIKDHERKAIQDAVSAHNAGLPLPEKAAEITVKRERGPKVESAHGSGPEGRRGGPALGGPHGPEGAPSAPPAAPVPPPAPSPSAAE